MMEFLLLLVLIPAALYTGYYFGRRRRRKSDKASASRFGNRYFRGLNYLLNEQPDKAIEVFLKLADVNQDTVETHFALGSLFRRRGEVDRAIRFHQNIIAKPSLKESQRTRALLELGEDYMRAGLLDRAERLFSELVDRDAHTPSALAHLLDIYQQEKDWTKAISIAQRIEQASEKSMGSMMAQFCCEQAEQAINDGLLDDARRYLRQARRYDQDHVRPQLLEARLESENPEQAIALLKQAISSHQSAIPEVLPELLRLLEPQGNDSMAKWLADLSEDNPGTTVIIHQAKAIMESRGEKSAAEFLLRSLNGYPSLRVMRELLTIPPAVLAPLGDEISERFSDIANKILNNNALYRCNHCGFGGNQHHWQCPGCRTWDSTHRIRGVLGE